MAAGRYGRVFTRTWASPLVTKIRLGMRSSRQAAALRASFALSTARRCLTAQRHSHTTAMTAILDAIATSTSEPGPLLARPVLRATPTVPRRPRPPRAPVFHCLRSARDRCMHGGFRGLSRGLFAFRPLVWRQPRGETSDDEGALSVQRAHCTPNYALRPKLTLGQRACAGFLTSNHGACC